MVQNIIIDVAEPLYPSIKFKALYNENIQKKVNNNEKLPKLIFVSTDLKIKFLTIKSFSNGIIKIKDAIKTKVLIFGLIVLEYSHNPIIKKIRQSNIRTKYLFNEIVSSKKIIVVEIRIVINKHIPPINGVGVVWIFLSFGKSSIFNNFDIIFLK